MNIIAPVFASDAPLSPAIEEATRRAMIASRKGPGPRYPANPAQRKPSKTYRDPKVIARQEVVKRLNERGLSPPEIRDAMGVSSATVWSDIQYLKLSPNLKENPIITEGRARRVKVAQLKRKFPTMMQKDMARILRVTPKTIGRDLKILARGEQG